MSYYSRSAILVNVIISTGSGACGRDWGLYLYHCVKREKRKWSKSLQKPSTKACSPACLSTWWVHLGLGPFWWPSVGTCHGIVLPTTLALRACPAHVLQPLFLPPEPPPRRTTSHGLVLCLGTLIWSAASWILSLLLPAWSYLVCVPLDLIYATSS